MSHLALGTMTWGVETDADEAAAQLVTFHDAGGTLVDTAASYGYGETEELLGQLLADVVPRADLVIATKAGITRTAEGRFVDCSRGALLRQLDESLRKLGTDYVDLWYVHYIDDTVPFDETLAALDAAVASGKVRYAGVSNYCGWRIGRAATLAARRAGSRADRGQPDAVLAARPRHRARGRARRAPSWASASSRGRRSAVACSPASTAAGCPPTRGRPGPTGALPMTGLTEATCARQASSRRSRPPPTAWPPRRSPSRSRGCATVPVSSRPVLGARTLGQLTAQLACETLDLPLEIRVALDDVSAPEIGYPEDVD